MQQLGKRERKNSVINTEQRVQFHEQHWKAKWEKTCWQQTWLLKKQWKSVLLPVISNAALMQFSDGQWKNWVTQHGEMLPKKCAEKLCRCGGKMQFTLKRECCQQKIVVNATPKTQTASKFLANKLNVVPSGSFFKQFQGLSSSKSLGFWQFFVTARFLNCCQMSNLRHRGHGRAMGRCKWQQKTNLIRLRKAWHCKWASSVEQPWSNQVNAGAPQWCDGEQCMQ